MRTVLEPECRDAAVGVAREEFRRARLALENVALDQLMAKTELGQQQTDLVAVARACEVVERQHRRGLTRPPGAKRRRPWPPGTRGCARRRPGRRAPPTPPPRRPSRCRPP